MKNEVRKRHHRMAAASVVVAMIITVLAATRASAQEQLESASTTPLVEVVVTGSRIASPNATSTSPIQVVTSKELQQGGKTDIIDLINQLPQNFQNSSVDFSNTSNGLAGPGGIATADLRGLGPQRTLVLINGRRLGIGDPNTANPNPAPDLDQIPVGLIDRIEVVTGGASAVYGSDAIAGVVNFIMKKDFEGIQIDGQAGEYMHHNHEGWVQNLEAVSERRHVSGSVHDGQSRSFNILMGSNLADGKGNVTAYVGYLNSRTDFEQRAGLRRLPAGSNSGRKRRRHVTARKIRIGFSRPMERAGNAIPSSATNFNRGRSRDRILLPFIIPSRSSTCPAGTSDTQQAYSLTST